MKRIFRFKKGKGIYGSGNAQVVAEDFIFLNTASNLQITTDFGNRTSNDIIIEKVLLTPISDEGGTILQEDTTRNTISTDGITIFREIKENGQVNQFAIENKKLITSLNDGFIHESTGLGTKFITKLLGELSFSLNNEVLSSFDRNKLIIGKFTNDDSISVFKNLIKFKKLNNSFLDLRLPSDFNSNHTVEFQPKSGEIALLDDLQLFPYWDLITGLEGSISFGLNQDTNIKLMSGDMDSLEIRANILRFLGAGEEDEISIKDQEIYLNTEVVRVRNGGEIKWINSGGLGASGSISLKGSPTGGDFLQNFQNKNGVVATLDDIPDEKTYQEGNNITIDNTDPLNPIINATGGSGGGATDLSITPNADKITLNSSTGTGVDLPSANETQAGLQKANFYKEGSWTPIMYLGENFDYTIQNATGLYFRVGNQVHFDITLTGIETPANSISDLTLGSPFISLPLPRENSLTNGVLQLHIINTGLGGTDLSSLPYITAGLGTTTDLAKVPSGTLVSFAKGNLGENLGKVTFDSGTIRVSGQYITNVYTP